MPKIIHKDAIVNDTWEVIPADFQGELPTRKLLLLPLAYWLENKDDIQLPVLGLWVDGDESDENIDILGDHANMFPLIAVNFSAFTDGRGFTVGRLLRERYNYDGQLRAIGNVIRDQLHYLKRCGFDSFDLGEEVDLEEALKSLNDFSDAYQGDVDNPPHFKRD